MNLTDKILDRARPVTLYELVPPTTRLPHAEERILERAKAVHGLVDAINIPEIVDETRSEPRRTASLDRIEPRRLAQRIQEEYSLETIVNRCVVRDPDPMSWLEVTRKHYGIRNLVLVGGDSSKVSYPGPSVGQAASLIREQGFDFLLGGITIPSRAQEIDRVRGKGERGIRFFTTQVLLDSTDIVGMIRASQGLEARIVLSFAPVSDPRDLEFLRWLGVEISAEVENLLMDGEKGQQRARQDCLERSIELAARVLTDVFENLPPSPPSIGLMVGHINQRNYGTSLRMLERLREIYERFVRAQA